jgi:serine/threonine protein kinase
VAARRQLDTTLVGDVEDAGAAGASVPAVVGRYRIRDRVGAGGMGVVYRGRDPELHRDVAIKLLRPTHGARPETSALRMRLLREARAMAQLNHPNVIPVFDVGEHDDGLFVAMQYVPGPNARQWLTAEERGWRRVVGVFRAAGRGLAAAHTAGLVHRDFKPANVIVGDDGRVRVLDFGLARAMAEPTTSSSPKADVESPAPWSETVTSAGAVVGTPMYMAPEQLVAGPVDARADQYAFCVALYEGLYGRPPFDATSRRQLAQQKIDHRLREPPPDCGVPPALFRIIERGTRPRPEDRYGGMPDILRELRTVVEGRAAPKRRFARWSAGALALASAAWIGRSTAPAPGPARGLGPDPAQASLRRAYFDAVASGDAEAAAIAAITLVEAGGPRAAQWRPHAQAQLEAAGAPADLAARLAAAPR